MKEYKKIDKIILAGTLFLGTAVFTAVTICWGGWFGYVVAGIYFVAGIMVLKT